MKEMFKILCYMQAYNLRFPLVIKSFRYFEEYLIKHNLIEKEFHASLMLRSFEKWFERIWQLSQFECRNLFEIYGF